MTDWTVLETPLPAAVDAADAWALHGAERVSRASDLGIYGHEDIAYRAGEKLAALRNQRYARRVLLVAVPHGTAQPSADDVVGTASAILPLQDNTHLAYLQVVVHPDHRRRGVGGALLDELERIAKDAGRRTFIIDSEHGAEPPEGTDGVLEPPTGSGRVRASDPGAVMATRRGYVFEQAERYSLLELPVDDALLARLHAEAAEKAGADYRLVSWTERTPDAWVDDIAYLESRMSTDAPKGGLEMEEDHWDAERVRTYEKRIADGGQGFLVVAAEHVPTGRLAAFTMVAYPHDRPEVVYQEDTLVLSEHRGRRLGMLVKSDLLRRLREVRPDARRIHTWNAEENGYMLGINVALGFRPRGVAGEWQKKL